ncbi:unnamed protein product [Protopolystoma xenopodis]|uniref:Uncharacterized protein n=1 Tax=Protopolystoma xenopodis TaxID=117903 RepID=A0A3S5AFH9_9PLAT|nr:unnamed protein product [Protopolystoma xenopodis]
MKRVDEEEEEEKEEEERKKKVACKTVKAPKENDRTVAHSRPTHHARPPQPTPPTLLTRAVRPSSLAPTSLVVASSSPSVELTTATTWQPWHWRLSTRPDAEPIEPRIISNPIGLAYTSDRSSIPLEWDDASLAI